VSRGEQNTFNIENGCETAGTAINISANITLNSICDDWFLPSKNELHMMYINLRVAGVGGFSLEWYWSSSEFNASGAWPESFPVIGSSSQQYYSKNSIIVWLGLSGCFLAAYPCNH